MRLATICTDQADSTSAAVLLNNGEWLDIAKAAALAPETLHPSLHLGSVQALIESWAEAGSEVSALVQQSETALLADARLAADSCQFKAPIPVPRKNVFCVGRNYAEHIAEGERAQNKKIGVTEHPVFFTKPLTAVVGPGESVPIFPALSEAVDYEVELAVIIGKAGRNIKPEHAFDHIFGYSIVNDITARDIQRQHGGQYFKGKSLDGSCPLGPHIVTADEIENPHNLGIRLTVNDELRQDGNTSDMIFDIPALIESLSQGLTLEPGDIIATGTPSGVGYAMDPPQFLKDGDIVTCEVDQVGKLQNTLRVV